jgi:hypothetical protein
MRPLGNGEDSENSLVRICALWRRRKLHCHFRNILEVAGRVQIQIGGVGHGDGSYWNFSEQRRSEWTISVIVPVFASQAPRVLERNGNRCLET